MLIRYAYFYINQLSVVRNKLKIRESEERKEIMRDIIMNLKLPQETKDFLLKTKIEKDEFQDINIKFFNKEHGVLCDVVEWTKINDSTVTNLDEKFVSEFLKDLEKFRSYYVVADNLDSGNLIAIQEVTGEIYELEHEVIEEVVTYFVNSSFSKFHESMNYFKKMKNEILKLKEEENVEEIEALFEKAEKELSLIDRKVIINDDEDNMQFWNGVLGNFREWCLE
ncbi:hypothetical protein Ccar_09465 [Clostridium carboxidivorans P7]|uniref:SUKH-4 immunity protein n=2 Tax=Clostridium TaxID=1485 RepID=C6PRK9_9CLOT|nr:hypothetical protein Ccar_09465 [Clostridium carboxidivorans P7]EET88052.1 conserved hypothetical protein [Clostridium carboxidivorans P7]EFG88669.1 hypothetical protein CLCAR_1414 [Clostridium carboxidivorans P7]